MAINNFTQAEIVDTKLSIVGKTIELGPHGQPTRASLPLGARLDAAAVAVDGSKRCKLKVTITSGFGWEAESDGNQPFANHDHIYAIGVQRNPSPDESIVLLWVDELRIGAPDPEL